MILVVVIIISCVYVVFSLKSQKEGNIEKVVGDSKSYSKQQISAKISNYDVDYTRFVNKVSSKKIFAQPIARKKEDLKAKALIEARHQLKSLKLVGVLGNEEKRAIVEDTSSNSTLYAYLGDKLLNKFVVKKIDSSTLILEFEGTNFTLTL